MRYVQILLLSILCGCGGEIQVEAKVTGSVKQQAFEIGDEVLFKWYQNGNTFWEKYTITDIQGDKFQFAGNKRYFELNTIEIQKIIKPEAPLKTIDLQF